MAEERMAYTLSPSDSMRWQQEVGMMHRLQQEIAEAHRQGSLGYAHTLDVFHPEGELAMRALAWEPTPASAERTPVVPPEVVEPQRVAQTYTSTVGELEGELLTSETITAYRMSPDESAAWARGEHDTRAVEAVIGAGLSHAAPGQAVPILMDDGRHVFTHGENTWQVLREELRHFHPVQAVQQGMAQLREQAAETGGLFPVKLGLSLQVGSASSALETSLKALEARVDTLATSVEKLGQQQAMGRETSWSSPSPGAQWLSDRLQQRADALAHSSNGHAKPQSQGMGW